MATLTTGLSVALLPSLGDLIAAACLMKLGKRLPVGEVTLCSAKNEAAVAPCTFTYSLPPN